MDLFDKLRGDPTKELGRPIFFTIGPVTRRTQDHRRYGPITEPDAGYLTVEHVSVSGSKTANDCGVAFHERGVLVSKRDKRGLVLRRSWSEVTHASERALHLPAVHGRNVSILFTDRANLELVFVPLRSAASVQMQEMLIKDLRAELKIMDDSATRLLAFLRDLGIAVV